MVVVSGSASAVPPAAGLRAESRANPEEAGARCGRNEPEPVVPSFRGTKPWKRPVGRPEYRAGASGHFGGKSVACGSGSRSWARGVGRDGVAPRARSTAGAPARRGPSAAFERDPRRLRRGPEGCRRVRAPESGTTAKRTGEGPSVPSGAKAGATPGIGAPVSRPSPGRARPSPPPVVCWRRSTRRRRRTSGPVRRVWNRRGVAPLRSVPPGGTDRLARQSRGSPPISPRASVSPRGGTRRLRSTARSPRRPESRS